MAIFKQAVTKSCELSSMIPLPRIIKAKTKCQLLLWTLALFTGLAFGGYQFIELVILYFRYPTSVDIKEISASPPFPDVTICHLDVDWTKTELEEAFHDVDNMMEYEKTVQDILNSQTNGSNEYKYFSFMKTSFAAYLQNVKNFQEEELAEIIKNRFIIGCSSVNITDMQPIDCFRNQTYKVFMDPLFGMCITFNDTSLMSLNLVLHLPNFDSEMPHEEMDLTKPDQIYPSKIGARVVIHPHNSFPDLNYLSRYVLPGAEYDFDIVGRERVSLSEPYGYCVSEEETLEEGRSSYAAYRHGFECYRLCGKHEILKQCGCLQIYYAQDEHNRTLCAKLESNITKVVERIDCAVAVMGGMNSDFKAKCDCQKPCQEFEYDYKSSETPWPHDTYHLSFYQKYINQSSIRDKFHIYEKLFALKQQNASAAFARLQEVDLIKKNFAYVRILNHQWKYLRYSETPLLSMESIIGSIGGLFNLWAGISFFTFIEILEFFYKWLPQYWTAEKHKKNGKSESLV